MSIGGHAFHQILLHFNWHCADDQPMLSPPVEKALDSFIRRYVANMPGVYLKGIGGTETHRHMAVEVEPQLGIAEFIGKIKGASARAMNEHFGEKAVVWQRGYGVCSFAMKHLPAVLDYIARQKEHHMRGNVKEVLEKYVAEAGLKRRSWRKRKELASAGKGERCEGGFRGAASAGRGDCRIRRARNGRACAESEREWKVGVRGRQVAENGERVRRVRESGIWE